MNRIEARYIYELERQLPNRNFARDHSFETWYEREFRPVASTGCDNTCRSGTPEAAASGGRHAKPTTR